MSNAKPLRAFRIEPMIRGSLLSFALFWAQQSQAIADNQCARIDKSTLKYIHFVKNSNVTIKTEKFGTVCLVGREIKNPFPDSAFGIGPSGPDAAYIQFSLIKNGKVIYDFPRPPDWLWGSFDNGIVSAAFTTINDSKSRAVLVIGRTNESNGSDAFQPLIYNLKNGGFDFNLPLSRKLAKYNIYSIKALIRKVRDDAAQNRN